MHLMDYVNAKELLEKYGIKTADAKYVSSANEATKFSGNSTIALKVISDKALHKSKSGLVLLNLKSKAIADGYNELVRRATKLNIKPYKILAQKMAPNGTEIIIGGKVDQQFGNMILVGLGGIYVETFKDFAVRICPLRSYDAESMIDQLRSKKIIAPDEKSAEMIKGLLMKISKMLSENNIPELDLNPIILHDNGYTAVDIRILR
jgi:succinyl-CoA synthetase beta subunit